MDEQRVDDVDGHAPGPRRVRPDAAPTRRSARRRVDGPGGVPIPPGILEPDPKWQPSVLAPAFHGIADYGVTDGAPGPLRVFHPSFSGSPDGAPIVDGVGHYPLVIFLHGMCVETDGGMPHYLRWDLLPSQLARSGYVVAVPRLASIAPYSGDDNPDLARAEAVLDWMRTGWPHAGLLMPRFMTAVVGHSWGALAGGVLSMRLQARHELSAFVSISGGWTEWPSPPLPLDLDVPAMFLYGTGGTDLFSRLDGANDAIFAQPRGAAHKVVFDRGEHWDYFREGATSCAGTRGPGGIVRPLAADLVTTFLSHYMPPQQWTSLDVAIPHSLVPPPLDLTVEQQPFAIGHLQGFAALPSSVGVHVEHTWRLPPFGGGAVTFGTG